jgi:DNA polymerase-3 subunit beta
MTTATATKERKAKRVAGTSVTVSDFKRALHAVAPAVPGRSPNPVLTHVLLSGETLTAFDQQMRIATRLDCYDGPDLLLPHARLLAIVGSIDQSGTVELKADGTTCIVKSGRGEWRLPMADPKEFPAAGEVDAKPIVHLPGNTFMAMLRSVKFATASESARYSLNGVLIEFVKGRLSVIGTDGRRLCVADAEVDVGTDDFVREPKAGTLQKRAPIVPRKVIEVLCGLADTDDPIQIDASDRMIVAEVGGTTVQASLIEGKFPAWRDVFPKRDITPSLIIVGDLLTACLQARVCTSEQSKGVTFKFGGEFVTLTSRSAEAGEADVECKVVEAGHACTVMIDPVFLTEWLNCGSFDKAETIEVEAESESSAMVLRAQDYRCVIMPLDPSVNS